MVKKIKKYLKFVVCCALIMSLVAPSYAALSASDGSAFVTKAEFDAALADFNARLTTFEAGINSKIDSQVTSYLDRNGIWNGKVQTLDTGLAYDTAIWWSGRGNGKTNWLALMRMDNGMGYNNLSSNYWYHTDLKMCTTTKTGLMHVVCNFDNTATFKCSLGGLKINCPASWEKQFERGICISDCPPGAGVNCEDNVALLQIMDSQTMVDNYASIYTNLVLPCIFIQAYFFVDKGDNIYFSMCHRVIGGNTSTMEIFCKNDRDKNQYVGDYRLKIKKASIY